MAQSANQNTVRSEYLDEKTQQTIASYDKLGTDDKLALLYYVYKKMGASITPAAPAATEPELAPILMEDFYNLSHDNQMTVMRDIVNRADTEYSHAYGALKENNQLMVWYAWAQAMGETVVGMPEGYSPAEAINNALGSIESLEFEEQISLLREIAGGMGYTNVRPIETQAETGKTASL
jgi:Orange carotenoid protein, N-terminal